MAMKISSAMATGNPSSATERGQKKDVGNRKKEGEGREGGQDEQVPVTAG